MDAPEKVTGLSIEWTGHHHAVQGDVRELSTHTVTYETDGTAYVTANGALVTETTYVYRRLDERVGVCIYHPVSWHGRSDVTLQAIFDFHDMSDRAVVTVDGEPFAVADGKMTVVPTPPRPE